MEFFLSWLRILSPLIMASAGAMAAESAGRTNMALEGQILLGAFVASLVMHAGGQAGLAVPLAVLAAGAAALILGLAMESMDTDPVIAALAANLAMQSLVDALSTLSFGSLGIARFGEKAFLGQAWPLMEILSAIAAFALIWIFVAQTRAGLRMRAVASDQEGARLAGLNPSFSRVLALTVSGMAGGGAGVLVSLSVGAWNQGMTLGRGWLALAASFVGGRRFGTVFLACLVMGTGEALSLLLQGPGGLIPELSQSFPYIMTILVLIISGAKRIRSEKT